MEEPTISPAPEARADNTELEGMIEDAAANPLFQALLDWIDGVVVILNKQRQIVMASPNSVGFFGVESIKEILGCRLGEVFRCIHSDEREGGCGTSRSCKYCGSLKAILKSQNLDEPVESEYRVAVSSQTGGDGRQTVKLKVRASKAVHGQWEFTVLVLQTAGPEIRSLATDKTIVSPTAGWPEDLEPLVRVRKIGEGGMGNVFLVKGTDGREYALKTIREEVVSYETTLERFSIEGELALTLDHPNIVKTYRASKTASGMPYMVSEYCERGSLGAWLQDNGPLPADLALYWMYGAARALDYLWSEHRLVHRDVKPNNLLVDSKNQVKLTDFGIALRLSPDEQRLTAFGQILGSVLYLAPEQIASDEALDVRADLYALGATFFELVTGEPPYDGATPTAILSAKIVKTSPKVKELRKGLPAGLGETIDWLIEKKPEARPQGPGELLKRLDEIAARENIELDEVPAKYS